MLLIKKATAVVFLVLFVVSVCLGTRVPAQTNTPSPLPLSPQVSPSASPVAKQLRQISYLKDGGLWLMKEDGSENRQIVPAPEEAAIANQIWARDGSRIYFNIGLTLQAYIVQEQKVENLGALEVPEGILLDRIELGNDSKTLLAHLIDSNDALNSVPKIYAV